MIYLPRVQSCSFPRFFVDAVRISLSLLIKVSPELAGGLHFHPDDETR